MTLTLQIWIARKKLRPEAGAAFTSWLGSRAREAHNPDEWDSLYAAFLAAPVR